MKLTVEQQKLKRAFQCQRQSSRTRGIEWQLTWEEWLAIWVASGHVTERGTQSYQYCMSRRGDEGPYSTGNVFIQTVRQNKLDSSFVPKKGCAGRTQGLKHGPRTLHTPAAR